MALSLILASSDEHFRESIRDHLLNHPEARIINEYPEVSANLYVRVLQELRAAS